MIILGINYKHGDAAACIIQDGKLKSAVEEERFTKVKNCSHFPINSIKYCLSVNNLTIDDVDFITVNSQIKYNFLHKFIFVFKILFSKFIYKNIKLNLYKRKNLAYQFDFYFNKNIKNKIVYVPHHLAHAYSTLFFLENNQNSLIFSFDGSGDFSTIEIYLANQKKIKLLEKNPFPHSLGFFYMAFTQFLGFNNYGDEYKIMGLSALGSPIYADKIKKYLIKSEYPLRLNLKYFNMPKITYFKNRPNVELLYNKKFIDILGEPRISKKENIKKIYKDYAASMQQVFEDIVFVYLKKFKKQFNAKVVYLTGGCALNGVLAGKILKSKLFKEIRMNPNPGDAGGALGSAFFCAIQKGYEIDKNQNIPFSGPSYDNYFIKENIINKIISDKKFRIEFFEKKEDLSSKIAKKIVEKKIVFWHQDSMEWGPRALGNRSILADPSDINIKNIINSKIKKRELFRPFAPVVLKNHASKYFYMHGHDSKYMNIVFQARENTIKKFPGVVHDDFSSRVQTIEISDNEKLYSLITAFNKLTGCPMLINTSLNINSPISMNPMDSFNFFLDSEVDVLILNDWLIELNK